MSKNLTIDFFKVGISQPSTLSFYKILEKAANTPSDQRPQIVRVHHIYLLSAQYGWQDTWEGEIVRLRMDDIPVKGNISGGIEDILLAHDEGIGEQSAFIYHPATSILALQSNRHGVSAGDFARYFELVAGSNTSITLDAVLQADAMQRLAKIKEVSKFQVRIASLTNMDIFKDGDYGVEEIVKLTQAFQAPSIVLELKTSRKKDDSSLSIKTVFDTAQSLVRASYQSQNKISAIRISGSSDEDEHLFIDLLRDKMRESIPVMNSGRNRNIPYANRQIALQEAWNRRLTEILRMYQ